MMAVSTVATYPMPYQFRHIKIKGAVTGYCTDPPFPPESPRLFFVPYEGRAGSATDASGLESFASRAFPLIVNQVIFFLLRYSLLQ